MKGGIVPFLHINTKNKYIMKEPAKSIKDLNNRKMSELTPEEYKQQRDDWDVNFNNLDFGEGFFKLVIKGKKPVRYHDKADAIRDFYASDSACSLFMGKRILMTRES